MYLQPNNPEPSRRILIFGDSNTYGFQPLGERYAEAVRYTGCLQTLLGPDVRIIEEDLPGRTCVLTTRMWKAETVCLTFSPA